MKKAILFLLSIVSMLFAINNETNVTGATGVQFYLRNYSYANLVLGMPTLSIGLATDNNRLCYKNSTGTLYKVLLDGSGATNTPANRIFYSNSSGIATSGAGLTFDGTTLYTTRDSTGDLIAINSVKGGKGFFNSVTSTRDSSSDVIANDSIIGKTGSFSSEIVTPSVRANTIQAVSGNSELIIKDDNRVRLETQEVAPYCSRMVFYGIGSGKTAIYKDSIFTPLRIRSGEGQFSDSLTLGKVLTVTGSTPPVGTTEGVTKTVYRDSSGRVMGEFHTGMDKYQTGETTYAHEGFFKVRLWRGAGQDSLITIADYDPSTQSIYIKKSSVVIDRTLTVNSNIDVNGGGDFTAEILCPTVVADQIVANSSTYNSYPLRLGGYYLWIDASGRLRIKNGVPTSDTDGTIVGTQS
jgi:hypothetical protein